MAFKLLMSSLQDHPITFRQTRYKLSDGTFLNLGGYRVRMSVKDHISDTAFVYQASSDVSGGRDDSSGFLQHFTITGANPQVGDDIGKFTLSIPVATTTAFDFNQGVYDLELVAGDGTVTRLLEGKFKIKLQVSV